jgi:hypothetical protein
MPHPAHEGARCALTVEPATRQVFLSETWPRAAVDLVVLGQLLNEHTARHRLWRDSCRAPVRETRHREILQRPSHSRDQVRARCEAGEDPEQPRHDGH